jgi:hypothetical protein
MQLVGDSVFELLLSHFNLISPKFPSFLCVVLPPTTEQKRLHGQLEQPLLQKSSFVTG